MYSFATLVYHLLNFVLMLLQRITVMLNTDVRMRFGGKKQSGMVCNIHSIAVFDKERNPGYFPEIFGVLTSATGLPASR